jgi:hypothetical protein
LVLVRVTGLGVATVVAEKVKTSVTQVVVLPPSTKAAVVTVLVTVLVVVVGSGVEVLVTTAVKVEVEAVQTVIVLVVVGTGATEFRPKAVEQVAMLSALATDASIASAAAAIGKKDFILLKERRKE